MRRAIPFFATLALVLLAVPAYAKPPTGPLVSNHDAQYAVVVYDSWDATACVETRAIVAVGNHVDQVAPGPAVSTSIADVIDIDSYDHCSSQPIYAAVAYGASFAVGDLKFGSKLSSATLSTTIVVCDYYNGSPCFPLTISLTLAAAGVQTRIRTQTYYSQGGVKFTDTTEQVIQPGTVVTAVISDGTTNYAQGPVQVTLSSNSDHLVSSSH